MELIKNILKSRVSACNKDFRVSLLYIGEGCCGDYDETNPDDEPCLRIDIETKDPCDRRRWNNDVTYSTCTGIPAYVTAKEAKIMCRKVLAKLEKISTRSFERKGEYCYQRAWETAL